MNIGKKILVKYNNIVQEGIVINIFPEDLEIKLNDETIIRRKYWEVRKIDEKI